MFKSIFGKTIILSCILLSIFPILAQLPTLGFQVGIGVSGGSAQNDFADQLDNTIWSLNVNGMYHIPLLPLGVGANIMYGQYGQTNRKVPFNSYVSTVYVREETTNNIFQGHLIGRFRPVPGPVQPYLDGMIGFVNLTTSTKITDEDDWDDEGDIASSQNASSSGFSKGWGAGIQIQLWKGLALGDRKGPGQLLLDIGYQQYYNPKLKYMTEDSIVYEDLNDDGIAETASITKFKTRTDFSNIRIGIVLQF